MTLAEEWRRAAAEHERCWVAYHRAPSLETAEALREAWRRKREIMLRYE